MTSDTDASVLLHERGGSALSGMLLVGGTSIGAGMLALPLVTGVAGFFPALMINTLCWLFMLATGLLLLEGTLWMKRGSNILSIAERFLGPFGKIVSGAAFIFLYYCLLVSYTAGGAPILGHALDHWTGLQISGLPMYLTFSALFGSVIYFGHKVLDKVNWLLMMSLILSYFLLLIVGSSGVEMPLLIRREWSVSFMAAPILFSAYGYHNIIPSMTTYLKGDATKLRLAIIGGTSIPFIVYSLWQWMILGTISQETLMHASAEGIPITEVLKDVTGSHLIGFLSGYFGFFALVTSFLGVALSMVDFFADGLKIEHGKLSRIALCALVFLPPTFFAAANPTIFVEALGIAGGFGEALLNGLFPIAVVFIGRYKLGLESDHQIPGGRVSLAILTVITFVIMALELYHLS